MVADSHESQASMLAIRGVLAMGRWVQRVALLLLLLGLAATNAAPSAPQPAYRSAEEAVTALVQAARTGATGQVLAILGPESSGLVRSGDPTSDAAERQRFLDAYAQKHALVAEGDGRMVLHAGNDEWPLQIPLVRRNDLWVFDPREGVEELVNRRIGRNEINAIRTCLAYVDAQQDYFDLFKQTTGEGAYAKRLVSTAGNHDGLYWPEATGHPLSPLAALVAQAQEEGYPGELVAGGPAPYRGYLFRILTAPDPAAPGGARDYLMKGRMVDGYALIAWPAVYGASGITSFVVDRNGVVFQKDLGADTAARVAAITRYDPDLSWARVELTPDAGGQR